MIPSIAKSQWRYMRHWLILILIAEAAMLVLNQRLVEVYLVIAALFLCGFLLRVTKLYPGKNEPLILDASAVFVSLIYAAISKAVGLTAWRFLLIFSSSIIILPHFCYILKEK